MIQSNSLRWTVRVVGLSLAALLILWPSLRPDETKGELGDKGNWEETEGQSILLGVDLSG